MFNHFTKLTHFFNSKFPMLKWAQNEERVWITIDLIDAEQAKTIVDIDEEKNTLEFK
jgi:uncharacterized protein YfbU (UPF0304 family)